MAVVYNTQPISEEERATIIRTKYWGIGSFALGLLLFFVGFLVMFNGVKDFEILGGYNKLVGNSSQDPTIYMLAIMIFMIIGAFMALMSGIYCVLMCLAKTLSKVKAHANNICVSTIGFSIWGFLLLALVIATFAEPQTSFLSAIAWRGGEKPLSSLKAAEKLVDSVSVGFQGYPVWCFLLIYLCTTLCVAWKVFGQTYYIEKQYNICGFLWKMAYEEIRLTVVFVVVLCLQYNYSFVQVMAIGVLGSVFDSNNVTEDYLVIVFLLVKGIETLSSWLVAYLTVFKLGSPLLPKEKDSEHHEKKHKTVMILAIVLGAICSVGLLLTWLSGIWTRILPWMGYTILHWLLPIGFIVLGFVTYKLPQPKTLAEIEKENEINKGKEN